MAAPVDPPAPEAVTPPEPVTPPPAAPQPGPWIADLTEYFGADNAEAIAAADRYMREKVQPERTRFETESAPARELFKDLLENPEETLAEVVAELYGEERPDVVEKFASIFADGEPAPVTPPEPTTPSALSKDQEEDLAWARSERQRKADEAATAAQAEEYAETLSELRTAHPELTDADQELIHPFIAAASGDTEVAYAGYQAFTKQFQARHGITPAEAEEVTPPPVLGSQAAAPAVPPTTKTYANIEEAVDDWFAERKASAPPVVGSV